jgi:hypothetical protein
MVDHQLSHLNAGHPLELGNGAADSFVKRFFMLLNA